MVAPDPFENDVDPGLWTARRLPGPVRRALARLRRVRALTAFALRFERVWLALWPVSGFLGAFIALSLLNVWAGLNTIHTVVLAGLVLGLGVVLWRARRTWRPVETATVLRRVEAASGLAHRPLATLSDALAAGAQDPATEALWRAHRARAFRAVRDVRAAGPRADLSRRDPFALRYLILLVVGTAAILAGDQAGPRLLRAVTPNLGGMAGPPVRVDAWIDPPAYTDAAPVLLTHGAAGSPGTLADIPAGASLVVRVQGLDHAPRLRVTTQGSKARPETHALARRGDGVYELREPLTESATVELRTRWRTLAQWTLPVVPDTPPVIAFAAPPGVTPQHSVRIDYTLADDFGVKAVGLRLRPKDADPSSPAFETALPAPGKGRTEATLHAYKDLTAHRWAGLDVVMSLVARDAANHETVSKSVVFTLPEREFNDPLARALISARKALVRDPTSAGEVAGFLESVTNPPARDFAPLAIFLGLRTAYWRLRDDPDQASVDSVVDQLWDVAIAIEDGAKGDTEMRLREARDALNQALADGADADEIARRIAELKSALSQYLRALGDKTARAPETGVPDSQLRSVTSEDLLAMLDQLDQLAQSGATGAAQALLRQLDDILENLQTDEAQAPDPNSPEGRQTQALQGLSKLMRDQRGLMDETFRQSQTMPFGPEAQAAPSAKSDKTSKLAERQDGLRQQLDSLMKSLAGPGGAPAPGGQQAGPPALGQALRAMQGARDALKGGQSRHAVERQKEALEALRNGAQSLAQALQGQGGSRRPGGSAAGLNPSLDPLGRPNAGAPDLGLGVKVPTKADMQKAREILDEIRRRAGELDRPQPERDYLDRLLERFK